MMNIRLPTIAYTYNIWSDYESKPRPSMGSQILESSDPRPSTLILHFCFNLGWLGSGKLPLNYKCRLEEIEYKKVIDRFTCSSVNPCDNDL